VVIGLVNVLASYEFGPQNTNDSGPIFKEALLKINDLEQSELATISAISVSALSEYYTKSQLEKGSNSGMFSLALMYTIGVDLNLKRSTIEVTNH